MGFSFLFHTDALALFMAGVSGFVSIFIFIYSLGYIKPYPNKGEFFVFMTVFLSSMMGLIFSRNLLLMYIFWEITAFCSWRLIGFFRDEKDLWYADKAFLVTFFGASIMLIGIILIYLQYGTLDLAALRGQPVSTLILILIMAGIFSKSAQLPLSSWLPDAGIAPTPVTALLHAAVLVKIGVYAYARLFCGTFIIPESARVFLLALAMSSGLVAAMSALIEKNIKRALAYSTISQLAYIFIGFILNSIMSVAAALLYILAHSIAKAGLFLTAGIVEQRTHTKDIDKLGGLIQSMPLVALAFLLSAFSIIGLPPFVGFFSKFYVVLAVADKGYFILAGLALLTAFVTLLYLVRLFNEIFLGEVKTEPVGSTPFVMTAVVLIFGVLSLLIGIFVKYPLALTNAISLILRK